jgi:ParB family transcriptional regulator, chromosome partitioning protein
MSLRDELRAKSQKAVENMGAGPKATDAKSKTATKPVTAVGAVAFMQPTIDALNERVKDAESRMKGAEAANEELRRKLDAQPTEVELELLEERPGRKRRLTPDQFEELKENLRNNPLVHPVAVKRLASGRFEIVSGHNRVDAFRALGRQTIPVVVVDIEEEILDRTAFYANLLQPSLPDFEKYLGFKREKDKTGATQKELAKLAGVPESTVSMLFAFESLPQRARELVEDRPSGIGMNCASELAKLAREGAAERVVEAVELLLSGKLTQKEAVAFAARKPSGQTPRPVAASPVKIKAGRVEFCQYVARGSTLRIDFKAEDDRTEAEKRIAALLKELAQASKADS